LTLLDRQTPIAARFVPTGRYRAHAGSSDRFADDVRVVWSFLQQAIVAPIALELYPPTLVQNVALVDHLDGRIVPDASDCPRSTLVIHTSGTTGTPQRCEHDLQHEIERKRKGPSGQRWLLTFAPFRWAGLSVMFHVWRNNALLIVPESPDPVNMIDAASAGSATHLSLTPSMLKRWRLSCDEHDLRALPLKQVTFGGEVVSQAVLNDAASLWPEARLTHVYAASEFGDICSVSDGLEGVPVNKFQRDGFHFTDEGELFIDGRSTGDIWVRRDDRYVFFGRKEEVINVGGAKVSPFDVERVAMSLHGVCDARAFPISSPLVGQLVGLEYRGTAEERWVKQAVSKRLPKTARPAEVRRVDTIEITEAGKTRRLEQSPTDTPSRSAPPAD